MSVAAILLASLLGSFHCAAMCGGFVTFCSAYSTKRGTHFSALAQSLYHLGRLIAYATLGAAAGLFGGKLNDAGTIFGVETIATWALGGLLVLWGSALLFSSSGFPVVRAPLETLSNLWKRLARRFIALLPSSASASLIVGVLSGLIPCGWLWGFVALAGASGSPALGALYTSVFWIGTVPALVGVGWGSSYMVRAGQRLVPRVTAVLVIISGVLTIVGHQYPMSAESHSNSLTCLPLSKFAPELEQSAHP